MRVSNIPADLAPVLRHSLIERDVQYNPETGALAYGPKASPKRRGTELGTLGVHGGRYVCVYGEYKFRAADVAWLMHHGVAPNTRALCLDGNPGNLKLRNLRETTDPAQLGRPVSLDLLVRTGKLAPEVAMAAKKARERVAEELAAGGTDALFMARLKAKLAALREQQARVAAEVAAAEATALAAPAAGLPDLF